MELGIEISEPDLVELPSAPGLYVRCGETGTCAETDNVSPTHPSAFFGDQELVSTVQVLAQRFQALHPELQLRLTDMSLPMGGMFDYHAGWLPPHNRHRNGRSIDICRDAWNTTTRQRKNLFDDGGALFKDLYDIAVNVLHMRRIKEPTIHFELMPLIPGDPCHP